MPTYRSAPDPSASTVVLPSVGTTATQDVWEEVPIEDREGDPQFTYFLVAHTGRPVQATQRRTGSA